MTNQTNFLTNEWNRREELVKDENFIKTSMEAAKKLGISAKEWNENKVQILLIFANEICGMQNNLINN